MRKTFLCIALMPFFFLFFSCSDAGVSDKDTVRPILTLSSPAFDGLIVALSDFTVSGVVFDTSGVQSIHIVHNGVAIPPLTGVTNWQASISLSIGTNTIEAFCRDINGNESEHIIRNVILDPDAIQINILSPPNNSWTSNTSIALSGTCYVTNSSISTVEVKVGNGSYQPAVGAASWSLSAVALVEGTNVITVRAASANGKTNIAVVNVLRDSTPPLITLVQPTTNVVMGVDDSGKKFQIIVNYSDTLSCVTGIMLVVRTNVDGLILGTEFYPAMTSPQTLSITIPDDPGHFILQVYATDLCGNTSLMTQPIWYTFTNCASLAVKCPNPIASGGTIDFGSVSVGNTVTKTIVLSNAGIGPLYISNISASGAGLTINTNGMSGYISSGDQTHFFVKFSPLALGSHSGSFTINSSALNPNFTINCQGQGVALGQQWVDIKFVLDSSNDPLTNNVPMLIGFAGDITTVGAITNVDTMGVFSTNFLTDSQNNVMQSIGGNRYAITLRMKLPAGETNTTFMYAYINGSPGHPAEYDNWLDDASFAMPQNNYSIPGLTVMSNYGLFKATWNGSDVVITNHVSSWKSQFSTMRTTMPMTVTMLVTDVTIYNVNGGNYTMLGVTGEPTWMSESGTSSWNMPDAKIPISFSPNDWGTLEFMFFVPANSLTYHPNRLVVRDSANNSIFGAMIGEESQVSYLLLPLNATSATCTRAFNGFN